MNQELIKRLREKESKMIKSDDIFTNILNFLFMKLKRLNTLPIFIKRKIVTLKRM